jgi:hypothetical protein
MNLLQIIQAVTGELGLVQPASVVGAADLQTLQMYNLVNREGDNLRRTHQWKAMLSQFTLNVGNPIVTTGNVTLGSNIISNVNFAAGVPIAQVYMVSGSSIPVAARITSVSTAASNVVMDMVGTGTAVGTPLTFARDTYPGPTDYDFTINKTSWDRTNRWELIGPDSPQIDQWHRSGIVTVGPRRHFRWIGDDPNGNYRLWPPPANVDTPFQIAWEYTSVNWCRSAAGTKQASMLADTDSPFLDAQAIILGVKWRFLQAKGFPTAASMQTEYVDYVQQLVARDGGAPTLNMRRRQFPLFITPANVPDGYWPGPTGPNMG